MLLHPAIAESGFGALGASRLCPRAAKDLPEPTVMCRDLLQLFAEVSDGRGGQGRVHSVAVVLALCAAAVVAGMGSFTAIAGWAADVPAELLAHLYGRYSTAPSKATIWRVVTGVDAAAVDAVIGAWLAGQAAAGQSAAGESDSDPAALGRCCVVVWWARLGAAVLSSNGESEFGEGSPDLMPWIDIKAEFVMVALEILDEGVSCADYSRGA